MDNKEIKMADEAESLENSQIVREVNTWQLVNGYGWEDTKDDATHSQQLYLKATERNAARD